MSYRSSITQRSENAEQKSELMKGSNLAYDNNHITTNAYVNFKQSSDDKIYEAILQSV